jgi:aldose 1-epimerase
MSSRISLKAGPLDLDLAPQAGGAVAAFRWRGFDLWRPMPPGGTVRESSCFPMLPYTGRIADGRFPYGGEEFVLPANMAGQPHAIHGDGWGAEWAVAAQSAQAVTLVYRHHGGSGWPYRYSAIQAFTLFEDGLEIRLTLVNEDTRAFPAGLGLHPYFTGQESARLMARLPEIWLMDDRMIPTEREPTPERWDFSGGRPVAGSGLDHCFAEWDGEAVIHWPDQQVKLQMTADGLFDHCVVYVPPAKPFFCVEPTSHRNNAVNQSGDEPPTGLVDLEPGEAVSGRVIFVVREDTAA